MESQHDHSLLMTEYGIDEDACNALQKLDPEMKSVCLQKLHQGMNSGKVRNPSGYIRGIVNGPDALGIDDKARELLESLPKQMQTQLLNTLRTQANAPTNPSAWIVSHAINAKKQMRVQMGSQMMGGQMLGGMTSRVSPYGAPSPDSLGIDDRARELLEELPQPMQNQLLNELSTQADAPNSSAWIVSRAISAKKQMRSGGVSPMGGQTTGGRMVGGKMMGGMMARASPYDHPTRNLGPSTVLPPQSPDNIAHVMHLIDEKARILLQQLPYEKQIDLASFLVSKVRTNAVNKPSAWMIKSCIAAGASESDVLMSGGSPTQNSGATAKNPDDIPQIIGMIDERAGMLFQQLPHDQQIDFASFLLSKIRIGGVMNPSAWMIKSCIAAGAKPVSDSKTVCGSSPEDIADIMDMVDAKPAMLLQQLPYEKQLDLASCLLSKMRSGAIKNPSAWMTNSCLAAGAVETSYE